MQRRGNVIPIDHGCSSQKPLHGLHDKPPGREKEKGHHPMLDDGP